MGFWPWWFYLYAMNNFLLWCRRIVSNHNEYHYKIVIVEDQTLASFGVDAYFEIILHSCRLLRDDSSASITLITRYDIIVIRGNFLQKEEDSSIVAILLYDFIHCSILLCLIVITLLLLLVFCYRSTAVLRWRWGVCRVSQWY